MMQPEPMEKQSRAGSQDVVGAVDRLSTLPDALIHTVLSFLPSPEVVRTCVLSRRWRNLWRSVPRISLDEEDFGISQITSYDGAMEEKWAKFEDFATNLLLFHDNTSSLGAFHLSSSADNQRHLDRWVRRGIDCGRYEDGISLCKMDSLVSAKIENDYSQQFQHELLCSLYNVTSLELVGFEVEGMLNAEPDKFPIFHNIRTLDLHRCFLDDYELHFKLEALGSFLQRAPGLEKLILRYCMFNSHSDSVWENERKNITLHRQGGKTFQCPKLMLIEVIYGHDYDHLLIELVWRLGRSLANASIKLKKIEKTSK